MDLQWRASPVDRPIDDTVPAGDFWSPVSLPGRPSGLTGSTAVAYTTTFEDPRDEAEEVLSLDIEGGPGPITVWWNGERAARWPFPYGPRRIALPEVEATNDLCIVVEAAAGRFAGAVGRDDIELVPAPAERLSIDVMPPVYISDLAVEPTWTEKGGVLSVTTDVAATSGFAGNVRYSVRPEGVRGPGTMHRASVEMAPGGRERVTVEIAVPDAERWSPQADDPARYTVRAKVDEHSRTATVGFRTVALEPDGLAVNGERVPLRGFLVYPGADAAAVVERAVATGANAIRPFAHVPPVALYDRCAAAGVLVWQDAPILGSDPISHEEGLACTSALASMIQGRPALAAIALHSDAVDIAPNPLDDSIWDRLKFRWRAYRATYDPSAVRALATPFAEEVPVVDLVGPPGIESPATEFYPGVRYGRLADISRLLDRYDPTIVAATGAPAAGTDDRLPQRWQSIFDQRDIADAEDSFQYQLRVCKSVVEAVRLRDGGGVLIDALADVTDAGGFGVVNTAGDPKPVCAAIAASFSPVQTMVTPPFTSGAAEAVLVNDGPTSVDATIEITGADTVLTATVEAAPSDRVEVGSLRIPDGPSTIEVATILSEERIENTYRIDYMIA